MSANTDSSHTINIWTQLSPFMALHQLKSQQLFLSPATASELPICYATYRICNIVSSVIFISSINFYFFFKPIVIFNFFYVKLCRIIVSRLKFPPVISVQHGHLILLGVIRISSLSLTSDC